MSDDDQFVQDHENDSAGGYDEFDQAIDFQIKKHQNSEKQGKKDSVRPESKHGRAESSKISNKNKTYSDHQEQDQQDLSQNRQEYQEEEEEKEISASLEKLNKYILFHKISLENFWKSHTIFVTMEQFAEFLLQIGLTQLTEQDIINLEKDLIDDQGYITIQRLCNVIESWKNQENALMNFIRERSYNMAQSSKQKAHQQFKISKQDKMRPRTAQYSAGRPVSGISQKSVKSKISMISDLQPPIEKPIQQNKSKYYLSKHKEREREIDRLLELTINKGKNEYEYEMLIKMGDANELSQNLNSKITYRAYKGAQGNLKVHVYEVDKFVKDLTLEEFQREYNMLRNKYNEKRNLKIWEVLSENKKGKQSKQFQKGTGYIKEDEEEGETSKKGFNKRDRQSELKKVLLDTMVLTNLLKEQLAILNKKGINMYHHQGGQAGKTSNNVSTTHVNH